MRDTAHLNATEEGVYSRLCDQHYSREKPLPSDVAMCCKLARAATKDERAAVVFVLSEFFTLTPDGYAQKRCLAEIAAYEVKAQRNREVGSMGGRPPKNKNPDNTSASPEKITQTVSENNPDGFVLITQTVSENNPSHKPVTIKRKEPPNPRKRGDVPDDASLEVFDRFWLAYPRKDGRKAALSAWAKLKLTKPLLADIGAGLARSKASDAWTKDAGQFIPHASTWLNGERWRDQIVPDALTAAPEPIRNSTPVDELYA